MTKPHEETWEADSDGNIYVGPEADRMTFLEAVSSADIVRARLVAQAPAMARLLLRVHDLGNTLSGCPICKAITGPHTPDCAITAVLRAAGALP